MGEVKLTVGVGFFFAEAEVEVEVCFWEGIFSCMVVVVVK